MNPPDNDHIYLYDGSWDGLLTAFYHACKAKEKAPVLACEDPGELFCDYIRVHADQGIAKEVAAAVVQKISRNVLYRGGLLYLSECADSGSVLYRYFLLGFAMGSKVDWYQSNEYVRRTHEISRKVTGEAHRFMGITRFEQTSIGVLYASVEPRHNIVPVIAPHFLDRLGDEKWIIHDVSRGIAALANEKGAYDILPFTVEYRPDLCDDELFFRNLWRRYYKKVCITERTNIRLRNRFIPPRYFTHLTEIQS